MNKTLILLMTSASTCLVENVISLVPGTPYDPPAGRVLLTVPKTTYVGPGFTGTLSEGGEWAFAPPAADEEPPPPQTVPDQISALKAKLQEMVAQMDELERVAVTG